jgi:tetratricopeptide (TPR) repeat protein
VSASACSSTSLSKSDSSSQPKATADEPESGPSAQELFVKGNEFLDRGEWERAIETYDEALKREKRWDLYLNKAIAHSSNTQFEAALDAIEKSLAHGGQDRASVYFNLGNVYQNRGLYNHALKAYRASLAHRDDLDADTLVNIGSTLTILGRYEDAKTTYERAEKLAPNDPRIKHGFAVLLYMEDEDQKSLDAFNQLLSMAPEYADGYYDRAHVRARQDDYRRAIEDLKRYLELEPKSHRKAKVEALIDTYRGKVEGAANPTPDSSEEPTSDAKQ